MVGDKIIVTKLCVCERWCVKDVVRKMVGDKAVCVCERWWVTKWCVKDGVCERWCVKDGV